MKSSQGIFVTVCDLEGEQDVLCGDGKDNDGDGKVDCLDEGCSGFEACISDENTEDACKDGIDNDNDGNNGNNNDHITTATTIPQPHRKHAATQTHSTHQQ